MKIFSKVIFLSTLFLSVSCLKEDDGIIPVAPVEGDVLEAEVGGPAQPYQVWVDLSTGEMKKTIRTGWDLGFYTGDEFAVILNTGAVMSATEIEGVTELSQVSSQSVSGLMQSVQVGTFDADNLQYVDDVKGNYLENGTVINEPGKIYLINMGFNIYEGTFISGTAYPIGTARGWKKIKVTEEGNGYKLEYADLDQAQPQEAFIPKDAQYNFTFFSMITDEIKDIQPPKTEWDLCFTVFVNEVTDNNGNSQGSYIFSDFVITNTMANTGAYEVITGSSTLPEDFSSFGSSDVDASEFIYNDHRAIGDHWRQIPGAIVKNDRFYVLKDPNGILFKIKFISMTQQDPNNSDLILRGHPVFEYEPL